MGGAKAYLQDWQEATGWAIRHLKAVGYGYESEIHDGVFIEDDPGQLDDAVEAGAKDPARPDVVTADDDLHKLFKEATQHFGMECAFCAKNLDD